jgi:carbohydrate kinase (thermoresistant glucokinase family)
MSSNRRSTVVIVMGVSGSGKTTIGRMLADRLKWEFVDADDLHSHENRLKMQQGAPLTDEDRVPWLEALSQIILKHLENEKSMILACSALRNVYREKLGVNQDTVRTVHLRGERQELMQRLALRKHAFFDPALLDSQLEILEEPDSGLVLPGQLQPEELVERILEWIRRP